MDENKLAQMASSSVLKKVGEVLGITVKELIVPVSDGLVKYGCRNQAAIVALVHTTQPIFSEIADKYFQVLYETIEISQRVHSENFDIILSAIFADEDASIETKVELANKIITAIEEQDNKKISMLLNTGIITVSVIAVIVASAIIGNSYINLKKVNIIQNIKLKKTKIIMNGIEKIIRAFNPINNIKEIIETIYNS